MSDRETTDDLIDALTASGGSIVASWHDAMKLWIVSIVIGSRMYAASDTTLHAALFSVRQQVNEAARQDTP